MTDRATKARHTRARIARVFDDVQSGATTIADVLNAPPACLKRIRVYDVLRRFPHLDRNGAGNVLYRAGVWPLRTMGQLTPEDKAAILANLPPRAKG